MTSSVASRQPGVGTPSKWQYALQPKTFARKAFNRIKFETRWQQRLNHWDSFRFDRRFGVDTSGRLEPADLTIHEGDVDAGHLYVGTQPRLAKWWLSGLPSERSEYTLASCHSPIKTVSVCGLGKLGACMAATLAARGFDVVGVDIDPEKVGKINEGLAPLDEPLLAETIRAGQLRLRASLDPRDTVATDATFFIPPSPSLPDGSFSNEFLLKAMQPVARAIRDAGKRNHLFVCSSTTTPGAIDGVLIPMLERELGGICGRDFSVCYNPEFIALGDVVNGLLEPDLVLIGESDTQSGEALEQLYKAYNRNSPRIARMSIVSAELTKISLNSYITMKISFTNQLRLIAARHPRADIHAILDAIGSDSRIGNKYLRAGLSYGGPCFPRDNRLLAYTARQVGLEAPLAEASDLVNEGTKQELVEQVSEMARPGDKVAVLGVTYRPNTYITEEAAGLYLAQQLKRRGYRVLIHDFAATPANSPSLHEFERISNWEEFKANPGVALAVICCPWPQYRDLAATAGMRVFTPWLL